MTDFPRPDLVLPSGEPLVAPAPAAPSPVVPAIAPAAPVIEAPTTSLGTPVITVDSSAAKGLVTSLATGLVRIAGTFLIAHGALTQTTADAIGPLVAQEIVGTALVVGGQFWALIREWLSHQKAWAAAFAEPSTIVVK